VKKNVLCILVLATVILLFACGGNNHENNSELANETENVQSTETHTRISASEAKNIIESGQEFILIDVRSESEFRAGHIAGAILIPESEIRVRAAEELPDKDIIILIYCQSGRRSASAAGILANLGYTNVYDFGGIADWPYEVIR
jgi:rhodanese-related sulfurtransferase